MGDPDQCAIARAVKRVVKEDVAVKINGDMVLVGPGEHEYVYDGIGKPYREQLPSEATTFISNFDRDRNTVDPFSFLARIPRRYLKSAL